MNAVSPPTTTREEYEEYKSRGLKLNMQRGQPSDADFALSDALLQIVGPDDVTTPSGLDIRNYSAGPTGIAEARALFGEYLKVPAEQTVVWNNASLELQAHVLTMLLLRGRQGGQPWAGTNPKMIVTVPGYDRHFTLLEGLGFELVPVDMQPDGPDVDAVERLSAADPSIRGIVFVPTYSNPGGETLSEAKARRLLDLEAANPEWTIFADDAYRAHHLYADRRDSPVDFLGLAAASSHPDRVFVYASTSKITYAGAGLGFVASSVANIKHLLTYLNAISIGPNKIEQYRHVKFLQAYPGGIDGLMTAHAQLVAPKFEAVYDVLTERLGAPGTDGALARWSAPLGGYFISLDTTLPVADRVVELAREAGVSLTPAGATYPSGVDPNNTNIRLAPTRPELSDIRTAMQVVAVCIQLASEEFRSA